MKILSPRVVWLSMAMAQSNAASCEDVRAQVNAWLATPERAWLLLSDNRGPKWIRQTRLQDEAKSLPVEAIPIAIDALEAANTGENKLASLSLSGFLLRLPGAPVAPTARVRRFVVKHLEQPQKPASHQALQDVQVGWLLTE